MRWKDDCGRGPRLKGSQGPGTFGLEMLGTSGYEGPRNIPTSSSRHHHWDPKFMKSQGLTFFVGLGPTPLRWCPPPCQGVHVGVSLHCHSARPKEFRGHLSSSTSHRLAPLSTHYCFTVSSPAPATAPTQKHQRLELPSTVYHSCLGDLTHLVTH